MHLLAQRNSGSGDDNVMNDDMNISISFNQNIFKGKLTHVLTNEFMINLSAVKKVRVTQSKRFPRPITFGENKFDMEKCNGITNFIIDQAS